MNHQNRSRYDNGRQKHTKPKPRRIMQTLIALLSGAAAVGLFAGGWEARGITLGDELSLISPTVMKTVAKSTGLTATLHQESVDVIGGSMAHGWLDKNDDSYLKRAFQTRSISTNITYKYVDHTVVGSTPVLLASQTGQFQDWLKADRPSVVVISWGLLNSMSSRHKVTLAQFEKAVHAEIRDSLAHKAVVLIVTPPVVQASATTDHQKQEQFIQGLTKVAGSFHSKNVYMFDVYHQMEVYMAAHFQTYKDYYGNSWHPDSAGHQLAGMLLANDLISTFRFGPIKWK